MTRRQLLRAVLQAGVTLPFVNYSTLHQAVARDPMITLGDTFPPLEDRIIVMLRMFGGNDGLNSIVPYTNDIYYRVRRDNPGGSCAVNPDQVLRLSVSDTMGFHPKLLKMHQLFEDGHMAIIQNAGYPQQDLSHFRSTDIWLTASDADVLDESGWLGRYFESKYPNYHTVTPEHPPAIEFNRSVSRLLHGKKEQYGFAYRGLLPIPEKPGMGSGSTKGSKNEQDYIRAMQSQAHTYLNVLTRIESNSVRNTIEYPGNNSVAADLAHVARLVASGLKSNVYSLTTDNMFDNHERLMLHHPHALDIIDSAVGAFQQDCENLGIAERVILVLHSEFGRRLAPSGSGTDHGAAGPVFVIGKNVQGGFYGKDPDLANLDKDGNIPFETDFRQIYATLLSSWFGVSVTDIFPTLLPHLVNKLSIFESTDESLRELRIAPNPCTTSCMVSLPGGEINDIRVFSSNGGRREISFRMHGTYGSEIDVQSLASGAYFVEAISGNQSYYSRFVKITP